MRDDTHKHATQMAFSGTLTYINLNQHNTAALNLNQQQTTRARSRTRPRETTARWESHLNEFLGNKTVIGEVSPADRYLYAAIITKRENNEMKKKTNKSAEAALRGGTVTGRLPCSSGKKRKRDELEDVEL